MSVIRFMAVIMVLLSCVPAFAFRIAIESGTEKIFRNKSVTAPITNQAWLNSAKNERESFQIVLVPDGTALNSVSLTISDLTNTSGTNILKGTNVKWYPVEYIDTVTPSGWYVSLVLPADEIDGWWPDALMPKESWTMNVPGTWQQWPVWVTTYVPAGVSAGDYRGVITVNISGQTPTNVTLNLKVWNFEIPLRRHYQSWVEIRKPYYKDPATTTFHDQLTDFYNLNYQTDQDYIDLVKTGWNVMLDHSIDPAFGLSMAYYATMTWPFTNNAGPSSPAGPSFTVVDQFLDIGEDRGMNSFGLAWIPRLSATSYPNWATAYPASYTNGLKSTLQQYLSHMDARNLTDRSFVYGWDEPSGTLAYSSIELIYDFLHRIDPRIKMQISWSDTPPNTPELINALSHIDIIGFPAQQLEERKDFVQELQSYGKEMWTEVCCWPWEHPNLFIDFPSIDHRMMGWYMWKHNLVGFEYWGSTYWGSNVSTAPRWPTSPWNPILTRNCNGDGSLLYPDLVGKRLMPSIRLENLRDGFDDFEYFHILQENLALLNPQQNFPDKYLINQANGLLDVNTIVPVSKLVSADRVTACTRRDEVGAMIDRIQTAIAGRPFIPEVTSFSASPVDSGSGKWQVNLTWTPPQGTGSADVTDLIVVRDRLPINGRPPEGIKLAPGGYIDTAVIISDVPVTTTHVQDTNVSAGSTYYYKVFACTAFPSYSNGVMKSAKPAAVSGSPEVIPGDNTDKKVIEPLPDVDKPAMEFGTSRVIPGSVLLPTVTFNSRAEAIPVKIIVFDSMGGVVKNVANTVIGQGSRSFVWDSTDHAGMEVATGTYIMVIYYGEKKSIRKVAVIR